MPETLRLHALFEFLIKLSLIAEFPSGDYRPGPLEWGFLSITSREIIIDSSADLEDLK